MLSPRRPLSGGDPEFERRIDSMLRSIVVWSQGELTLVRAHHCSDDALFLVEDRCQKLEVLSIQSCPRVTDAGISQILLKCINLRELDLSYCYEVSHESLVLEGLKDVKKLNHFVPRSGVLAERYGHWRLYDELFHTDSF